MKWIWNKVENENEREERDFWVMKLILFTCFLFFSVHAYIDDMISTFVEGKHEREIRVRKKNRPYENGDGVEKQKYIVRNYIDFFLDFLKKNSCSSSWSIIELIS